MVLGIDSYHDSSQKGRSVGGVVASMNQALTRYYSRCTFQSQMQELLDGLKICIKGWIENCSVVSASIFFQLCMMPSFPNCLIFSFAFFAVYFWQKDFCFAYLLCPLLLLLNALLYVPLLNVWDLVGEWWSTGNLWFLCRYYKKKSRSLSG